jgi:hypothetical protein
MTNDPWEGDMFKQIRGMQGIFFSKQAQMVGLLALFCVGWAFVRRFYWPLYSITPTKMGVAFGMQLVGLVIALVCFNLTRKVLQQSRSHDFWKYVNVALCALMSLAGFGLVAATLFTEVGNFAIELPGVTLYFPGTIGVADFVAGGRLVAILLIFLHVLAGSLFCEAIASKTKARAAPSRQHVMAVAE